MKDFIEFLVKQIVSNPTEVSVSETTEDGIRVYKIKASPEDMGVIIGKEGRNIKSLRNLAKAKAIKDNERIKVIVEELQ